MHYVDGQVLSEIGGVMSKRVYVSFGLRLFLVIMFIIFLWPIMGTILGIIPVLDSQEKNNFIIVFSVVEIVVILFIYLINVSYYFNSEYIGYKYPFLKENKYLLADLKGWVCFSGQVDFYFKKTKLSVPTFGKQISSSLTGFMRANYDEIKNRNIETIKKNGFEIILSKNRKIIIREDFIEVISNNTIKEYGWNQIHEIKLFSNGGIWFLKFKTLDELSFKFTSIKCCGGIGLLEFLGEKKQFS